MLGGILPLNQSTNWDETMPFYFTTWAQTIETLLFILFCLLLKEAAASRIRLIYSCYGRDQILDTCVKKSQQNVIHSLLFSEVVTSWIKFQETVEKLVDWKTFLCLGIEFQDITKKTSLNFHLFYVLCSVCERVF